MNINCTGCFADNDSEGNGCTALSERIAMNCPFYKTKQQYIEDMEECKGWLQEHRPRLYTHYYGKECKSAYR